MKKSNLEDSTTVSSQNSKRIAKNTLMLYFRQILILLVSLYTVRVVLDVLGAEDYGIYNVVAGVVTMISFLSGTMSSATQRFFSFALGKNDNEQLKNIFSVNIVIYIGIAVVAVILLETIGLWFVNNHLEIPDGRFDVAMFIYHFAVLTFVVYIITSPFMAIIIAHEDMHIFAYVSILETLLKLGVVFLLMYINVDKLELYGVLLFIVAVINAIIYISIATKKYKECQFKKFYWDNNLFKEITSYTGWTLFGQISTVSRNQGLTILVNQFFNPIVVASRSIALNIGNHIGVFANNFNTSLYPPIIKSYSSGNRNEMFSLIYNGSRLAFFLMWVISLPMLLELEMIFNIWLKETPPDSILFTRFTIIESLILSLSFPLTTAARAPGKMKTYELTLGIIQISIFVVSWIVLRMGGPAYSVFLVAIIANILMFFVRLFIVRNLIGIPVKGFMTKVAFPVLGIAILSAIPTYILQQLLPKGLIYSIIVIVFSILVISIAMYYLGLDRDMRRRIIYYMESKKNSVFKK